jgi:hypothetical protein
MLSSLVHRTRNLYAMFIIHHCFLKKRLSYAEQSKVSSLMWRESPTCWPKAGTVRKPNPRRHQLNATQPKYDAPDSLLEEWDKKKQTKEAKVLSVRNWINAQIHLLQYSAGGETRGGRMSRKSHYSTDDGSRSQISVTSLTPARTGIAIYCSVLLDC